MAFNYETLRAAIQTSIDAATGGFRYFPINKWPNLEVGYFPSGSFNLAYSIRISDQDVSDYESGEWSKLKVVIEFGLKAKNDGYLSQLGNSAEAIAGLKSIAFTGKKAYDIDEEIFSITPAVDIMLVRYDHVFFEIG